MKRLRIVKAHKQIPVGTVIPVTASETPGNGEITATEAAKLITEGTGADADLYDANEALKARLTDNGIKAIKAADKRARKRGAYAPKEEKYVTEALAQFAAGADIDVITASIDGMEGTEQAALGRRAFEYQQEQNGAPVRAAFGYKAITADPFDCAVKACERQNKMDALIKNGQMSDAVGLSREVGVIYASDVMPLLRSGGDCMLRDVVRAADVTDGNVGTVATGLMLMRNLGFLKNKLAWMQYLTTDFRNEPATFNQPVFTRYITPPAVTSYNTTTGWSSSTPSTTDVTVTINRHKGVQVEFQNQLLGSTMRNLLDEQRSAQFYSLAENVNQDLLTTLFGGTWTGTVSAKSIPLNNWNLTGLIGIKNAMTLSKIPDINRFVLLHSSWYDGMLTDANLLTSKAILALLNKDQSAFESGELPQLFGIKPLESQLAIATNGTLGAVSVDASGNVTFGTNNQIGFAGNSASALFVARVPKDYTTVLPNIPATAALQIVTDPDSGLSILYTAYVDHGLAKTVARCSLMWGFGVGDPRQGIILKP